MTPAEIIAQFDEPSKLMRHCYLHIAGGATRTPTLPNMPLPPPNGVAEIKTFKVSVGHQEATGFTTGLSGKLGKTKQRVFAKINKLPGPAKNNANLGADEFNAYYIPMVQTSDVTNGTSHYSLPTNANALDIMITSKLSGCTFGVGSNATGGVLVSHVQPNKAIAQDARGADLSTSITTGFPNAGNSFSKGDNYENLAAVIGHRTGNDWSFFLQSSAYRDSSYVISSVAVI